MRFCLSIIEPRKQNWIDLTNMLQKLDYFYHMIYIVVKPFKTVYTVKRWRFFPWRHQVLYACTFSLFITCLVAMEPKLIVFA